MESKSVRKPVNALIANDTIRLLQATPQREIYVVGMGYNLDMRAGLKPGQPKIYDSNIRLLEDHLFHWYCQEGAWMEVDGIRTELPENGLMCAPAAKPFRHGSNLEKPGKTFWFRTVGAGMERFFEEIRWRPEKPYVVIQEPKDFMDSYHRIFELISFPLNSRRYYRLFAETALLMAHVIKQSRTPTRTRREATERIHEVVLFLQKTPEFNGDLEQLAQMANLSTQHFRLLFKKETGFSPGSYLHRLKARVAATAIMDTRNSVAEVAESLGFEDPFYFSKWFSKWHGMAPSKFRELHLQNAH